MKNKTKKNAVNAFFKAVPDERTANGALTYSTTMDKVLDLFSMGGALRSKGEIAIQKMVLTAFKENPVYTLRCLFYLRDIRQGVGERNVFRISIKTVLNSLSTQKSTEELEKIMSLIPEYGRWDDLYTFFDTPNEHLMLGILEKQFQKDRADYLNNKPVSLLAKWLCSENTSCKETVENARKIRKFFGMSPKEYRKTLSSLRKHIDVTEVKMSSNRWEDIDYSTVPSIASKNYNKAFFKHDKERRESFLKAVEKGEKKMNVSVLTPCDIIKYLRSHANDPEVFNTCDIMFKSLPDFCGEENALVVADVSGSMCSGRMGDMPICASIGLGLYFASKNKGIWKDKIVTFSSNPNFISLGSEKTLQDKYFKVLRMEWGMSTNVEAVFDLILTTAKNHKLKNADLPKKLYIVSDMEFNEASNKNSTIMDVIKDKYSQAGYTMPILVFWNVNSSGSNCPVRFDEKGTVLVSGYSTNIFKNIVGCPKQITPVDLMLEVLDGPRYNKINI